MKIPRLNSVLAGLLSASTCLVAVPGARANDWVNPGTGDWADPANWNPAAVPDATGGWAIGNVANGGTAVISTAVPAVSEAWAGNGGVAGHIIVTNGGTLTVNNWLVMARMYQSASPTPFSTLTIHNGTLNKSGDGLIVGDNYAGMWGDGQMTIAGTATVNVTGGWWGIGNGASSRGTVYIKDDAVVNAAGYDFNVGDYGSGAGVCYISDNARLNVSRFWIGKSDTVAGALWQTGGAINGIEPNANEWTIGGDGSAHIDAIGFYHLSAGSLTCPFNFQVGRYGIGLLYQTGGTITQSGWSDFARYPTGRGIGWLRGGTFTHNGTGTHQMVGEQGRGELTIEGTAVLETTISLWVGQMATATGFLNLNGGTVRVPKLERLSGLGYLSFNGGVLQAKASDPAFLGGFTDARVYAGNAIFDTAGYNIGVSQPLLAPTGSGVVSIAISSPGSGYVAAPAVEITGDGFGALAVAEIDRFAGTVTNIVITCPGRDYTWATASLISGANSLVVPASLDMPVLGTFASGGVIKNGAGTLTLSGANTYSGATVVNAGALETTTASTGGGAYTLADGTRFALQVVTDEGQLTASSLTLGSSTGMTLDLDLGNFGNPTQAPIRVVGALAVNGVITINIADALPQLGSFPLIKYGSRSGSGNFVLGTLPTGVQATLATNVPNSSIDLVISAVAAPRWDGQAGGFWDIGLTANWIELSTGLPAFYQDGQAVLFNDAAQGTTTVNLVANVQPASVTVNNTNLNYTLVGTGKIGGAGGLTKRGTGTFTIANSAANDYTGITTIAGGTLVVTNLANGGQPSAIGAASAAPENLVLAGGTLSYAGAPAAANRGYSVQAARSAIDAQSNLSLGGNVIAGPGTSFVKTGPATLTYTGTGVNELAGGAQPGYEIVTGSVVFDGSAGSQVNNSPRDFYVGSTPNSGASLALTNSSLNVGEWLAIGRGTGSSDYLSTLTLHNSAVRCGNFSMGWDNGLAGNLSRQLMVMTGNSTLTNAGDVNMGESGGSTSTILMKDNSIFFSDWRTHFGWHNNATGIVTVADSALMVVDAWLSIGHEGGVGTFTVQNNGRVWVLWDLNVTDVGLGEGTFNLKDNGTVSANNFFVGKGTGSTGVFNQTGGTAIGLSSGNEYHIGFHGPGTWNLSNGSILAPNHWFIVGRWADGPGTLNVTGGSISHGTSDPGKLFRVGEDGTGVMTISGTGVVATACNEVTIGWNATGNGTVNLDGGVFQARRIIGGSGYSMFNFNGGVLRAGPNANPNFMTALSGATIFDGGAIIDTGTNWIAINQDLTGSGGLTKRGSGALALNGYNSYVGPTVITEGGFGGNGTLLGPVSVQATAAFSPGTSVGAITINNTLGLAGTTLIEIDKANGTNDQVLGVTTLTYGGTLILTNIAGTLVAEETFKIFDATTYQGSFTSIISANPGVVWDTSRLGVDGTVKVLSTVSTTPVNLTYSLGTGGLTVGWPLDHTGWRLLAQTNAITVGLSNNWVAVPGSDTTNQVTLPVNPANGSVFLRLVYP
jgi:autotransporter-associated beta strand protein